MPQTCQSSWNLKYIELNQTFKCFNSPQYLSNLRDWGVDKIRAEIFRIFKLKLRPVQIWIGTVVSSVFGPAARLAIVVDKRVADWTFESGYRVLKKYIVFLKANVCK